MPRPRKRARPGDWTAMIGTTQEVTARGIKIPRPTNNRGRARRIPPHLHAVRGLHDNSTRPSYPVTRPWPRCSPGRRPCCATPTTTRGCAGSTRSTSPPRRSPPPAMATSPSSKPTWLRVYAAVLMFGRGGNDSDHGGVRGRRAAVPPIPSCRPHGCGCATCEPRRRGRPRCVRGPGGRRFERSRR